MSDVSLWSRPRPLLVRLLARGVTATLSLSRQSAFRFARHFPGQFDSVDWDLLRVEENIVGEEVRQHSKTAGTLDAQRWLPGDRLCFDKAFATLEAEGFAMRGRFSPEGSI